MALGLLGCIGEGGYLDSADLSLAELLFFDLVGVDVCLLGGGGILDIGGQFDSFVVVSLVAVLCDLSVGLRIEILRFYCWDVSDVTRYVRVNAAGTALLLLA